MDKKLAYIEYVHDHYLTIICNVKEKQKVLRSMGAYRKIFFSNRWYLIFSSTEELAKKFEKLQEENFFFLGGTHGWMPADVFCFLREKHYVHGEIVEIVWYGKNKINTRKI